MVRRAFLVRALVVRIAKPTDDEGGYRMDIAVIGAGIAGLSAAWTLRRAGHRVLIFERSYKPGGRMNSRRKAGLVVDHGDRYIRSDTPIIGELIVDCGLRQELRAIKMPIYTIDAKGELVEGDEPANDSMRATFPDGLLVLGEALRRQMGGYYSIGVKSVEWDAKDKKFVLQTEPPLRAMETRADAIMVATPASIAFEITKPIHSLLDPEFLKRTQEIRYTSCFTAIAAMSKVQLPTPFYGAWVAPVPGRTIQWVAFEDLKCAGREVANWSSLVAHATPEASARYAQMNEESALRAIYEECQTLIPHLPAEFRWARSKFWDIARLCPTCDPIPIDTQPSAPKEVLVEFCGDYRAGDGCVASASSGSVAAQKLHEKINARHSS
jgi:predicted NAD/FAD-dependent oxidoreductase